MALTGCNACLKYLVLIFNLLFWLAGVGILSIAIWVRVDYATYVKVHDDFQPYYTGIYVLMAAGTIMTLVGFFGCCGAYRESQCMLGTYFALLLVIFAVEVAAGIWAYVHKKELGPMLQQTLQKTIQKEYSKDSVKTEAIDLMQKEFQCCGSKGPSDWAQSNINQENFGRGLANIGVAPNINAVKYNVPLSCCKSTGTESSSCDTSINPATQLFSNAIYEEGCASKLEDKLNEKLWFLTGIGTGIAVIEVLGMIFSMVLCCALRRERYKA